MKNEEHFYTLENAKEWLENNGYLFVEKPLIPEFVAEWIERQRKYEPEPVITAMNRLRTHGTRELIVWFESNPDLYARAWLDGYEVEKEKMYRVVFPFTGSSEKTLIQRIFTGNTWADDVEDDFEIIAEDHKVEFTEQEIKSIDERYFAFAEEVTP